MNIIATLYKPYSTTQRADFVVKYNGELHYDIEETEGYLQAVDYSDEHPVDTRPYLDLVLGESPVRFTAPSTGRFSCVAKACDIGSNMYFKTVDTGLMSPIARAININDTLSTSIDARKGQEVDFHYDGLSDVILRFYR